MRAYKIFRKEGDFLTSWCPAEVFYGDQCIARCLKYKQGAKTYALEGSVGIYMFRTLEDAVSAVIGEELLVPASEFRFWSYYLGLDEEIWQVECEEAREIKLAFKPRFGLGAEMTDRIIRLAMESDFLALSDSEADYFYECPRGSIVADWVIPLKRIVRKGCYEGED